MALTTGFPPSNTISPSVRIEEVDLSFVTTTPSFHQAGLVGFASKGPINIPTRITSLNQLTSTFGYPHPDSSDPYLIYAAQAYLHIATELYVVRVAETDNVNYEQAATASVAVPGAGGQIQIISNVAGPYDFTVNSFFRWRLNDVLSVKILTVLAGSYTTDELVATLNDQLSTSTDGIEFYNSGGYIGVETTFAYGPSSSLELVSVQDSMYGGASVGNGGNNVTGLGQGMTEASVTGTADRYPFAYQTAGNFNFAGLTNLNLQIVVAGTENVLIDNIVQVIDLSSLEGSQYTAAEVVQTINNQITTNGGTLPGGWTASVVGGTNISFSTNTYGQDAQIRIKSDSTAATIFGFTDYTYSGTSPTATSGDADIYDAGIVDGSANSSGALSFTIYADSPGQDGNSTQVIIKNNVSSSTFNIFVFNNGSQVESWGNLTKDSTSSYYVESYISEVSDWISVVDNTSNAAAPAAATYTLAGGSDGIPSDPDVQDSLIVGNALSYTGLYSLSDPEQIDIDLVAAPGHSSTTVVNALIDLCENYRQDCLAIIDPPFGLTATEIVAWQNGAHPLNTTQFNSNFAALYYPWVKIYDSFNGINVWAPPSGSVMATIASSDILSEPWFAPAGELRGLVPGITDVFSRPTLAERDAMYGNRNAVNPIVEYPDVDGFTIWGQKTLQRVPTALDRINVRRMMLYVEKTIKQQARRLLFEPNDQTLWKQFIQIATSVLQDVKSGRGLTDFMVVCDSTINTSQTIENNELWAQIGIQPTYAAEFIFIEFALFRLGTFSESSTGLSFVAS